MWQFQACPRQQRHDQAGCQNPTSLLCPKQHSHPASAATQLSSRPPQGHPSTQLNIQPTPAQPPSHLSRPPTTDHHIPHGAAIRVMAGMPGQRGSIVQDHAVGGEQYTTVPHHAAQRCVPARRHTWPGTVMCQAAQVAAPQCWPFCRLTARHVRARVPLTCARGLLHCCQGVSASHPSHTLPAVLRCHVHPASQADCPSPLPRAATILVCLRLQAAECQLLLPLSQQRLGSHDYGPVDEPALDESSKEGSALQRLACTGKAGPATDGCGIVGGPGRGKRGALWGIELASCLDSTEAEA